MIKNCCKNKKALLNAQVIFNAPTVQYTPVNLRPHLYLQYVLDKMRPHA